VLYLCDARAVSLVRPQITLIKATVERGLREADSVFVRMCVAAGAAVVELFPDDAESSGLDSLVRSRLLGGCSQRGKESPRESVA
jgi:hypothetical protein